MLHTGRLLVHLGQHGQAELNTNPEHANILEPQRGVTNHGSDALRWGMMIISGDSGGFPICLARIFGGAERRERRIEARKSIIIGKQIR